MSRRHLSKQHMLDWRILPLIRGALYCTKFTALAKDSAGLGLEIRVSRVFHTAFRLIHITGPIWAACSASVELKLTLPGRILTQRAEPLGLPVLGEQAVLDHQLVHFGAHEATIRVLGGTDDRLAPDIERCIDQGRT